MASFVRGSARAAVLAGCIVSLAASIAVATSVQTIRFESQNTRECITYSEKTASLTGSACTDCAALVSSSKTSSRANPIVLAGSLSSGAGSVTKFQLTGLSGTFGAVLSARKCFSPKSESEAMVAGSHRFLSVPHSRSPDAGSISDTTISLSNKHWSDGSFLAFIS